jgi:hypothetical protein
MPLTRPRASWWLRALPCFTLLALLGKAHAQTPGWLRYHDGNVLSGSLIEQGPESGQFRSDRFGAIQFQRNEAAFEPTQALAELPTARHEGQAPAPRWQPSDWSIGLSGYWKQDDGTIGSDISLDLASTWINTGDELRLNLEADYKTVDREVDNNEQSGSLRWLHDLSSPWFVTGSVKARRDTVNLEALPELDYLLMQSSLGMGLRHRWSSNNKSLVAVSYDRVMVDLLDYRLRHYTHAGSVLIENKLQLMPRISLNNTLYLYFWRDGSTGVDSLTELSYQLSEGLSVGIKHDHRRNAVNLDLGTYNRLSLTTRIGF